MPARWSWTALLKDPPPVCAFELSEAGMATAALSRPPRISFAPWPAETISASPLRDNVLRPDLVLAQAREAASCEEGRKRRRAALILPDYAVRVTVLDFDDFPSDGREQASLVRFRLKRSVPFDVESAALSYFPQRSGASGKRMDVVTAIAPLEIVARYEAPFRQAGFHVGCVTTSTIAALNLVSTSGLNVLVKRAGGTLSLAVVDRGGLKLARSIELTEPCEEELVGHLVPTLAYVEDQLGAGPDTLLICGFGEDAERVRAWLESELAVRVTLLTSRLGQPGEFAAGLTGYVESLGES